VDELASSMMSARIEDHFASDPITGTFGDHPTEAD